MGVIDLFEMVEVRHHDSHGFANPQAALSFAMQQAYNRSAVPQAGQMVMRRFELQCGLHSQQRLLQLQNSLSGRSRARSSVNSKGLVR